MKLRGPNSPESSPQKEMVVGRTLLRGTRDQQIACRGISRLERTAFFKHFGNCLSCTFDAAEQLLPIFGQSHHVNGKRLSLGTDAVVNVGEVTYDLILPKTARGNGTRIRSRRQANVESVSRAIDKRGCLTGLNEHPSAMAALLGVSLQRNTPVAMAICATTVSERDAKCEKSRVRALRRKSGHDLAVSQSVYSLNFSTGGNQFRKFVRGLFNLTKNLRRVFLDESYYHDDGMVLRAEPVMRVHKIADDLVVVEISGPLCARVGACEQGYVKALSIGPIDQRSLLVNSDKALPAVGTLKRVLLQRGSPFRAGRICNDDIRSKDSGRKSDGQKTLSVNSLQTGVIG